MNEPWILLFLKAPVPGRVKTRLAAEVGDATAVAVYRQLVEHQLRLLPPRWHRRILVDPPDALPAVQDWLGDTGDYRPQVAGDLGERLQAAVADAFTEGASSVFCIGGDCPTLTPSVFHSAAEQLGEGHDLVFVPAEDGGYVLAGLGRPCPEMFTGIPWSSSDTLRVSLERVRQAGRRVTLLPPGYDVDTRADLERVLREADLQLRLPAFDAFSPSTSPSGVLPW